MKVYITKKMIEDALMADVIKPSLDEDGLKCYIGEYWFFFGGSVFETTNPSDISFGTKVEEIKLVLDDFYEDEDIYEDEYLYYYYYLCEHI